ncbi:unnamed protein product [Nezara viridula]|uniref:Deacetylase sirtuin-type domain-containing protein n=1 Tax=Nezara viridula TaxID=85310 RepID=A0A9P0MQN0_NEZVI|nr:unnamed protein product [Nezara viridula]
MAFSKCKSGTAIVEETRLSDPQHSIKGPAELLREPTLEEVASYIKEIKPLKIVVISGGRISTPLGIPDLRSPDVGFYHAPFDGECYCCDVLDREYFIKNPAPLYQLTSFILEQTYRPTFSHYFISFLEHKKLLLKNYTQNMDDLEKIAGVTRYTQVYGSFYSFVCIKCKKEYSVEWAQKRLFMKKIMMCTNCASLIKPNILLNGEEFPLDIHEEFEEDMKNCKLLIVLGSTLSTEPSATILRGIDVKFPRVFINDVEPYDFSDYHFYCDHEHNDVMWLGDIDSTCKKLVKLMGWCQELHEFAEDKLMEPGECETNI